MKLEIAVLAGAESKAFLADLTKQIDRLERLGGTKANGKSVTKQATSLEEDESEEEEEELEAAASDDSESAEDETEAEDEEEEFTAKKATKTKAKAKGFDDEEEEDEPVKAKATKTAKPKKVTLDDVNDACRAKAGSIGGKNGIAQVRALLKKKFKTESVGQIPEAQWPNVIALMQG